MPYLKILCEPHSDVNFFLILIFVYYKLFYNFNFYVGITFQDMKNSP